MAANTVSVNGNLAELYAVFGLILDSINEINMKAWTETTRIDRLLETNATLFSGLANPANETGTRTSTNGTVQNAQIGNVLTAYKALTPLFDDALDALRIKDWNAADVAIAAMVVQINTINTDVTAMLAAADDGQQGANRSDVNSIFGNATTGMAAVLAQLEPMVMARRNKDYSEVERIYSIIRPVFTVVAAETARDEA